MSGSSRFGQLALAQTGEIERRLQTLEKRSNEIGARASTNSRDFVGDLSEVIASALSTWADRFRQGAGTVGDQSAALGKDAARLGTMAMDRSETKLDSGRWLQLRSHWAWEFLSVWPYGRRQGERS